MRNIVKISLYGILVLFLFWTLAPTAWMVLSSFKPNKDIFAWPPKLNFTPTLENYIFVTQLIDFQNGLFNSLLIAGTTTLLVFVLAVPAAYSISRFRSKLNRNLSIMLLTTRMSPPMTFLLPFFLLMIYMGLLGSHFSVILAHTIPNLGFATWILKSFFDEIPKEIDESALVDGCSRFDVLYRIALPLALPSVIATLILVFMFSWNEFMFALVLSSVATRTLTAQVPSFISFMGQSWGPLCAGSTIIMFPMIVFALLIRKYMVRGLTMGAVKG